MGMKTKLILILATIIVSMILAGCTAPEQKAWVEISCDEFYDNHNIDTILEVQEGETFQVKLCSNPSTGFKWGEEAQISDPSILKQEEHIFIGPESEPPPPPGTPGQEIWTFKALQQGSSKISLEYSRPWEGGEKGEWTCTIEVVVKESSTSTPDSNGDENHETAAFENMIWVLESYGEKGNPQDVIKGSKITAKFQSEESKITGSGGCNHYFGGYQTGGNKLTIGPYIASTEMACMEPEGVMDQEYQYLRILQTAEDYQVKGKEFVINCGVDVLIFITE